MVNFTVDQIRQLMGVPSNIRNMTVIAHVDHGKSTLSDSLIQRAGIIAKATAGQARWLDTRADEQERTITIKATSVSLYFEMEKDKLLTEEQKKEMEKKLGRKMPEAPKRREREEKAFEELENDSSSSSSSDDDEDEKLFDSSSSSLSSASAADGSVLHEIASSTSNKIPFLINLIDSPGHVDFSSEVSAALRVTDGALVVVDSVEGVCVQTETVLRQTLAERIRPVLFLNKLDRIFLEQRLDLEAAYHTLRRSVESVNVVISTYRDDLLGDVQVDPVEGTVAFGAGKDGWGVTLQTMAAFYARKYGVKQEKMVRVLWGDYFFDSDKKIEDASAWSRQEYDSSSTSRKKRVRGFVHFILRPLAEIHEAAKLTETDEKSGKEKLRQIMEEMDIRMTVKEMEGKGKELLRNVMQTWLPAADAMLSMIVNHLPSPIVAQSYRVYNLYSGPMDDDAAHAIRTCDPSGPLMIYISKQIPVGHGRFIAFGRIFSGHLSCSQTVRIQGPDYIPGRKADLYKKKIQRIQLMMGRTQWALTDAPCGNLIGLVGVDRYLLKSGTITTDPLAHNIVSMKYSVAPVVRVAVEPANSSDLPKLLEGLRNLAKSDPLVQCITSSSGEHIIAGAGELHMEICLKDLRDDFLRGVSLKVSEPAVALRESISANSPSPCLSKSANKHNRLLVSAQPLTKEFCSALDDGDVRMDEELKIRAQKMVEKYSWDRDEARKLWAFGALPETRANALVDVTKGATHLNEVRGSCVSGFEQATAVGVLCGEPLRGCRFDLVDVKLHSDAAHRGGDQIIPVMRKALYAAQLCSSPCVLEPVYSATITTPLAALSGVHSALNARRGTFDSQENVEGTPLVIVKAFLPVLESFGFTKLLRENTSGQAFEQMVFSHWEKVNGDIFENGSLANRVVKKIRERKGLKATLPQFEDYNDKL